MIKVFVSGFYDIVHAGHLQFFREARALGDHLTVSFASTEVLWRQRQRRSSLPDEHKGALIASLGPVDEVVIGGGLEDGLEFKEHFLRLRPQILAVTEDDRYAAAKQALCAEIGARYVVLPKTPPQFPSISTSEIVRWIRAPQEAPLRQTHRPVSAITAGSCQPTPRSSSDPTPSLPLSSAQAPLPPRPALRS